MKKQFLGLAIAAVLAVPSAYAGDQSVDLSSGYASFIGSQPVLLGGDDVITFNNLAAGTYDFLLSVSSQNLQGLAADLNGQAAVITTVGKFSFASLESTGNAPFILTLSGTALPKGLYSGELTVTPVPEPQTYALLLAGLGVIGFVAGRRKTV